MQTKTALSSSCRSLSWAIMPLLMAALSAPAQAAQLTTLFNFDGSNGAGPSGKLVLDASGSLYGTTSDRGTIGHRNGSVYKLAPPAVGQTQWMLTTLVNFNTAHGQYPSGLIMDPSGNLYGTTYLGGAAGDGTAYRIKPPTTGKTTWTLATLINFSRTDENGTLPRGSLARDASGNLYGAAATRGLAGYGTAFKLSPPLPGQNQWTVEVLTHFNYTNGEQPYGDLIWDASGNLYGIAAQGGAYGSGTVFRLSPPAAGQSQWKLTTLASFFTPSPNSGLVMDAGGRLYGTTFAGGTSNYGTVFRVSPPAPGQTEWKLSTLFNFHGTDGRAPIGPLLRDKSGNLYGTTVTGGANGHGTVFKLSRPTAGQSQWTLATLAAFGGTGDNWPNSLIMDASGILYGTTRLGGTYNKGTVFKLTP